MVCEDSVLNGVKLPLNKNLLKDLEEYSSQTQTIQTDYSELIPYISWLWPYKSMEKAGSGLAHLNALGDHLFDSDNIDFIIPVEYRELSDEEKTNLSFLERFIVKEKMIFCQAHMSSGIISNIKMTPFVFFSYYKKQE